MLMEMSVFRVIMRYVYEPRVISMDFSQVVTSSVLSTLFSIMFSTLLYYIPQWIVDFVNDVILSECLQFLVNYATEHAGK